MDVDDLACSSDATCYKRKGKADAKKERAFINRDKEAGETALRTPEVVASGKDENRIHSIAICISSCRGSSNGTTTGDDDNVPEAFLVGEESYCTNPSHGTPKTSYNY